MKGTCPLADPDIPPVCLQVPHSRSVYISEGVKEHKNPGEQSRCFRMDPETSVELVLPQIEQEGEAAQKQAEELLNPDTPPLYAERSFTGHGQERGGVQTILTNPSESESVEFVYMESLPWFMRIYLHTLQARVADPPESKSKDVIQEVYYRPALDRARGTQLEVRMQIPPKSTVFLTYDFEKSILRYTEYPPDANRGFDVAAAVITILDTDAETGTKSAISNLRTTTLLLSLPTPDFSMPYNVIIFTSTAIALAFGGLFNIIVRRFVAADEGPQVSATALKEKLKSKLRTLLSRTKASKAEKTE